LIPGGGPSSSGWPYGHRVDWEGHGGERPKTDAERGLAAVVYTPFIVGEAIDFKFGDPES
jgi:hypothetical protein